MTSTHEFDAYLDTQPLEEPPYHEHSLSITNRGTERKRLMSMTMTGSEQLRFLPAIATKRTIAIPATRRRRVTDKAGAITPTNKALLQSAEEVRKNLRDSLVQVNALIREIKAQRQQERLLKTTMDSLRKLSLV